MHFLKAAFVTALFFGGLVVGKDIAITLVARMSTGSAAKAA